MKQCLLIAVLLFLLPGVIYAGEKEDCLNRLERTEEIMMEVRHDYELPPLNRSSALDTF